MRTMDDATRALAAVDRAGRRIRLAWVLAAYVAFFWLVLPVFLIGTGRRLDVLAPVGLELRPAAQAAGWGAVAAGAGLMIAAAAQLTFQGRGLPFSPAPPRRFIANGLYRLLRHPIYVGYTLCFGGAALLIGSFWCLAYGMPLLILGWIAYVLFYEEPRLVARFGEPYERYRASTALLVPKPLLRLAGRLVDPVLRVLCGWLSALANRTILFRAGDLIMVTYGALVAVGSLIAMQWMAALFVAQGVSHRHAALFLIGAPLSGAFCAYAVWWLGHWRTLVKAPHWGLTRVGFVSFGNLFGLVSFSWIFAAAAGYPALMVTDVLVRGMFAAYALGRIGCLTYGCCYGLPAKRYGVVYEHPEAKAIREQGPARVVRSANQVFSFVEGAALFVLLNALSWAALSMGFLTGAALVLYAIGRTFVEFNRDRVRGLNGVFTHGHAGCLLMLAAGWAVLFAISPAPDRWAPRPFTWTAFLDSASLTPVVLMMALIVFLVCGYHRKRVGSW